MEVSHLTYALNLVSDYILVASGFSPFFRCFSPSALSSSSSSSSFSDDGNATPLSPCPSPRLQSLHPSQEENGCVSNFHDHTTCKCEKTCFKNILFINSSLYNFLGYHGSSDLGQEEAKHREEISQQLKGSMRGIQFNEGKIECKVALQNAFGSEIHFYASGTIQDDVHIFKLRVTTLDENEILKKFFLDTKLFMSIVETGPDDGTYEWRHLMPNKFVRDFFCECADTLDQFETCKRNSTTLRKDLYDNMKEAKKLGESVSFNDRRLSIFPAVTVHLHTDPFTKRDAFGLIIFDFAHTRHERDRMADILRFFEEAPMMLGVLEYKDGEMFVVHSNKLHKSFYAEEHMPRYARVKDLKTITNPRNEFYKQFLQENREHGNSLTRVYQHTNAHGDMTWLQTIFSLLQYDKESNVSQHAFCAVDITAQKLAEIEMQKHKHDLEETIQLQDARFRSLVSNAPNIILSINRSGTIIYANRCFAQHSPPLVGQKLQLLICEKEELADKIQTLFEMSQSFNMEVKLLDSDIWLTLNAGVMAPDMATVIATDITSQKLMAESLVQALSVRSRFLANMSHEVRTPLSGIIGMSRILMDSGLSVDQTECVVTIQHCGEQLLSVINDVLDYTKLEATGMKLDNAEFSLHQCAEESIYAILPAATKKDIELLIDIDHSVPDKVMGDIIRVQQVLINLLNNAVKFTDQGYILISLTGSETDEAGMWKFYFSIKDTGCGVPKENQCKLFKMFSQVDPSTTRRYGGTGIGLALAKRFSEMMHGDVTMQSSGVPGEGSTFFFNLTAALVPFNTVVSPPPTSGTPHWFIGTTNIFILEKLPIASTVLKKKLVGMGFMSVQICNTTNVEETFEGITEYVDSRHQPEPSIVFCNIDLISVHTKYSLFDNPHAALVLLAYTRPTNLTTDYPPNEYLRKPIKHNSLTRVLKDIWEKMNHVKHKPHSRAVKGSTQVFPLNIMVVEDNEMNQKVIRRVFQHLGYTENIPIANHGQECLDMIEKDGLPDIILMDVQMPVLDGVEATKIIRRKYKSDRPYIVSMTADAFPEDRQACFDAGMNDFLTKPIRIEQLQTALAKCYRLKELQKITDTQAR